MKNKTNYIAFIIFSFAFCCSQDIKINWIEVQGGKFTMGKDNSVYEIPLDSFCISATEVTFDQYDVYCKATGIKIPDDTGWKRGNRPVINVSWDDAVSFCQWLGEKLGCTIRLPTEAEWEYSAIGGNKSKGYKYSGSDDWEEVSWSEANSENKTRPVGSKKPNELGLYDMSGNVWEWCIDWPLIDDTISKTNKIHPLKGNSFDNPASNPRHPAVRIEADARHYNVGFRIVKIK